MGARTKLRCTSVKPNVFLDSLRVSFAQLVCPVVYSRGTVCTIFFDQCVYLILPLYPIIQNR